MDALRDILMLQRTATETKSVAELEAMSAQQVKELAYKNGFKISAHGSYLNKAELIERLDTYFRKEPVKEEWFRPNAYWKSAKNFIIVGIVYPTLVLLGLYFSAYLIDYLSKFWKCKFCFVLNPSPECVFLASVAHELENALINWFTTIREVWLLGGIVQGLKSFMSAPTPLAS